MHVMQTYDFVKFGAVVTDNTAANKLMWEHLEAQRPKVFFHGCLCRALRLVVNDLVESIE